MKRWRSGLREEVEEWLSLRSGENFDIGYELEGVIGLKNCLPNGFW
jgi:hypothetical protein